MEIEEPHRTHTQDSNHSSATFVITYKNNLKKHNERVHKLSCDYEAEIKSDFVESIHEGIKPFKCKLCDFKCDRKYDLNKHKESVHKGIKPFKCINCRKKN